jgi:hypothetical protein
MRFKAIAITALFVLFGCHSAPSTTDDSSYVEFKQKDLQIRQECISAGHADQSKAYFDCIKARWASNKNATPVFVANNTSVGQDIGFKQLAAATKQCDRSFAKRKLKSNYERGKCMNAAFEKYATANPPANKSAFETFQTDILLIMVRLDKKEITHDEAQVLMRQSANKLAQAENVAADEMQRRQAAWAQQAYQSQVQQQQSERAKSEEMMQGFAAILQNYAKQQQQRSYTPSPAIYSPPPQYAPPISQPVTTQCNSDLISGGVTCTTR